MIFDKESASDAHKFLALPKHRVLDKQTDAKKNGKIKSHKKVGSRKMNCRELSDTRFPKVSCWSEPCSRGKRPFKVLFRFRCWKQWNDGNRLKHIFAKFHADQSHVRWVNGRSLVAVRPRWNSRNVNNSPGPALRAERRSNHALPVLPGQSQLRCSGVAYAAEAIFLSFFWPQNST